MKGGVCFLEDLTLWLKAAKEGILSRCRLSSPLPPIVVAKAETKTFPTGKVWSFARHEVCRLKNAHSLWLMVGSALKGSVQVSVT